MPIFSAIIGVVGAAITAVGSFIAPLTGALGGLGLFGRAALSIGLNLAAAAVQKAFAKKPAAPVSGVELDLQYGENVPRKVMCGRFAVAGHFVYPNAYGPANETLQQVFVLSDFYTTSLDKVWIDGELASLGAVDATRGAVVTNGEHAGKIWIKYHDGRQAAADSGLVAGSNPSGRWTAAHKGTGISYVVVTMEYDQEKLTQPPQFLFEAKGAPLYDWRKDSTVGGSGAHRWNDVTTWEFSENPALMFYAYHRGFAINGDLFCGMEVSQSDLPLSKLTLAANICDETVDGGPRYRCSIGFDCTAAHGDNIEAVMTSCGGILVTSVGEIYFVVGTDQSVVATLTDDDLVVGQPVSFQRRRAMDELVNSVSGTFPNPDNLWSSTSYATARDAGTVAIDRRTRDVAINFDTVPYPKQAGQLAAIYYSENRFEATASLTVRPRWQVLEVADWITWNSARYGSRTFMVTDMQIMADSDDGPRNVVLSLQERSGDIYAGVGITVPPIPLGPATPVYANELQDFTVTAATGVGSDSQAYPIIRASWTAPTDPTVSGAVLQWRVKADPANVFEKIVGRDMTIAILSEAVVRNTTYEARHILRTDPARPVVPAAWKEVTTTNPPSSDVTVGLRQARDDVYGLFERLREQVDDLESKLDLSAGNASADTAERFLDRNIIRRSKGEFAAFVETETQARIDGDEALASSLTAVGAKADDATASGLFKIEASAGTGGSLTRLSMYGRAEAGGVYREAGAVLDITPTKASWSFFNDQFNILKPDGTPIAVFGTSGADLLLQNIRVGSLVFDQLSSANGKLVLKGSDSFASIEVFS
ncbi:phage tail protein [Hoeflea sp. YIM 152468]|uniref:phage tail protein n=1 Tax=Hoeflea sp. YIM 152468 TaxID=3031759 RepID=UPI0023DB310F|nr:phage tail protein [Hoeflea sp. YIM 152468]MDF1606947.1 phage tail protein [Hoeflea sp. YIM 152468]